MSLLEKEYGIKIRLIMKVFLGGVNVRYQPLMNIANKCFLGKLTGKSYELIKREHCNQTDQRSIRQKTVTDFFLFLNIIPPRKMNNLLRLT